jgi:hypothetical protein
MGADQLAFVAGKAVRTGGADLAVVVDWGIFGCFDGGRAGRTALWEIAVKFIVEDMGPVGKHG